ncbi:MAG: hypothetical protein JWP89_217 [Schlesneria sp.]|nr:hypothetical protein [Schlesneria sp.]
MKLTIGMACHRDFDGVYFTINALRLTHPEVLSRCEIVVVDNDPQGPQAERLRGFLAHVHAGLRSQSGRHAHPYGVKYITMRKGGGTTQPREEIFRQATGDAVLVLDCHVLLWPGAIAKLLAYYETNPGTRDLLSGPLFYDDHNGFADHFQNQWRDGMWGTWGVIWRSPSGTLVATREDALGHLVLCDPMTRSTIEVTTTGWAGHESWLTSQGYRSAIDEDQPFEIPAMGLGCFSSLKCQWPGFNAHFREFGGEEWYIHEKVRQRGGRALCLPFLKWQHRFGDPGGGRTHHYTTLGKVRNYVLGHQELRLPLDRLRRHFVEGWNEEEPPKRISEHPLTTEQFDQLVANPQAYPPLSTSTGCVPCGAKSQPAASAVTPVVAEPPNPLTLDERYAVAASTPSDINEHCSKLRKLASQADVVVEFGMRHGVSTVALLAGQPREFHSYDLRHDPIADVLEQVQGKTAFSFRIGDSRQVEIPECDLLFIDTKHTAEQLTGELAAHASRVRRRIVLHDTEVFGEQGEDGDAGLLVALRQFLQEHPEWSVVYHTQANHGLTVISRDPADKPPLPGSVTLAASFVRALSVHVADGSQHVESVVLQARLSVCTLCDQRRDDRCAVCGCFITTKAEWREQECPLGKWRSAETVTSLLEVVG